MIRAFRDLLRREDVRRGVAVVALLALVAFLVVGAAHAGSHDRAGDARDCGVCLGIQSAHAPLGVTPAPAALAPVLLARVHPPADGPERAVPARRSEIARAPPVAG